jgi:alanyl-tRNA synthetase
MKYHDPFLFDTVETITSVEYEDSSALLEFSDTIFYPGGGGQPRDHGTISIHGEDLEVTDVIKQSQNQILHKIKLPSGYNVDITPGISVELRIDKNRRNQLVRMHTGEHLFMGSLLRIIPDIKVEKIRLEENESSLFLVPPKGHEITWEQIFKAEEIANNIIRQNRKVMIHLVTKDNVETKFPKARIKVERIKTDDIRVVEIDDHDFSACAGVHCTTTGFIGNFIVTKFNKVQDKYELRFQVNSLDKIFELSKYSRESASILKVNPAEVPIFTKQLLKEKDELKEKFRESLSDMKVETTNEKINDITLRFSDIPELDKKQTSDKLNEIFEEFNSKNEKQCLILFKENEKGEQFSMKISEEIGDTSEIIKELNIKGGGRGIFASGICDDKKEFIDKLKKYFERK